MIISKKIIYAGGIFVCYFCFGILQEKITRSTYGESDQFTYANTLVFIQCVGSVLLAKVMLHTLMKSGEDFTKHIYYMLTAFSYFSAMICSTMALKYVNYPTQVVGKSCKPIPVMILGVLIARKKYSLAKYLYVFMIVVGICIFMYKDKPAVASSDNSSILGIGEILLLVSLSLDGLTGAVQDKMKSEHQTKPAHMMYNVNLYSCLVLSFVVLVTGEIWSFVKFVEKYPYVIVNILMFTILSALGQIFIYLVVTEFGPLLCSIITTSRKFFTVLASILLFGNSLTPRQWLGTILVFAGLTLDAIYGKKSGESKKT